MKKDSDKKLIEFIKSKNINHFGFVKMRRFNELVEFYKYRKENNLFNEFEENDIEKKINPFLYMEDGKTIISLAFPYLYNHEKSFNKVYFSKYTRGHDYHLIIKNYLNDICTFIESLGYMAIPLVDSNSLPERFIAEKAGIGFIGKNNLLITEEYGSYVFLAEIITNLDVSEQLYIKEQSYKQKKCGNCSKCIKICPGNALEEDLRDNDFNKCLSYLSQKKELLKDELLSLKGRLFGCDSCQDICPLNEGKSTSNIEEFYPKDFMENIDIEEIINSTNKDFNDKYKRTSSGWRGKNILKRNALAALEFKNRFSSIGEKNITSEYVKKYYDILKKDKE